MAQKDNCLCDKTENKRFIHVNPLTYTQIHTPTVVQAGWMEAPPPLRGFDMLQYFETMKPFNGGTAGGGAVTSSTMVTILGAILDFTKNWKSG